MNEKWVATPELRFVERVESADAKCVRILQQYYTVDVPSYMRSRNTPGEWRDVPLVTEK